MNKFNIGDKVILSIGSYGRPKIKRVEKVHKTTRFTLEGSTQQYTQCGSATGNSWVAGHCVVYTEEKWKERITPYLIKDRQSKITKEIYNINNLKILDQIIKLFPNT